MAAFRRLVLALAALGMLAGLASAQTQQQMNCTLSTSPNTIRLEGKAEQVGDIVITCTGGSYLTGINPTTGIPIPKVSFTVQLGGITNALTSRVMATGGVSDAMLLIDQPGTTTATFGGFGSDQPPIACNAPTSGNCSTVQYGYVGNAAPITGIPIMSGASNAQSATAPNVYQGILSGTSVTFFGVPVLAPVSSGQQRIFRITNLRVDASTLAAGASVTASVTFSGFSGSNAQSLISLPNNSATVAVAQNGLSATNTKVTAGSSAVCVGLGTTVPLAPGYISALQFAENFGAAFKTRQQGSGTAGSTVSNAAGQNIPQTYSSESGLTYNGITGLQGTTYTTTGLADFGTRLKATFANIPTGVRVFVSTTNVATAGSGTATITTASQIATNIPTSFAQLISGSESAVDGSTGPSLATASSSVGGTWAEVSITGGAGTAVWEVENTNSTSIENFIFNVALIYSANVPPVTGTTANPSPTVLLSYAPTTGTGTIPLFQVANSTPSTAFNLTSCRTILLFPYITNASGFDTGIAISNTSSDPLGTSAQAGACTLNWYPSAAQTATTTVAGTAITPTTTPTVIGGTTYLNVASVLAPGFTGYMVAVCNFQYAHGFAFVANWGNGPSQSSAMGYLALVIPDPGAGTTNLRASGAGGTGEALNQ